MNTTFEVTEDQLVDQLILGSKISDSHYTWMDMSMQVISTEGPRTAQQTAWYLETGRWVDSVYTTCGVDNCLLPAHITDSLAQAQATRDEELMQLVQRQSVSLASLYRKGKARGLISSSGGYGG